MSPFPGYFCLSPFDFCYIDRVGDLFLCCPGSLPVIAGNLAESSFDEVWNSETAQAVRNTIHDGTFSHCYIEHCPQKETNVRLEPIAALRPGFPRDVAATRATRLDQYPEEVIIAYDPTCNLSCPFCRCGNVVLDREEKGRMQRIHDRVWKEGLKDCKLLRVAGDSDPFASRFYREALRDFDAAVFRHTRINLVTNGLLFTPKNWEYIRGAQSSISHLNVSINSASEATFTINQRGGRWDVLLRNMAFIKQLHAARVFETWSISFIVQQNNFREIPDFIRLGREYGVDVISFVQLMPGPLRANEFEQCAIHRPTHPEHGDFLRILEDESLRDKSIYWNTLVRFLPENRPPGDASSKQNVVGDSQTVRMNEITWQEFHRTLGLRPVQSQKVMELLNSLKDDFAATMAAPAKGGGLSPVEHFRTKLQHGEASGGAGMQALYDYAEATIHAESNASYGRVIKRLQTNMAVRLGGLLDIAQQQALAKLGLESLLLVQTGYDPFSVLLAGGDIADLSTPEALACALGLDTRQAEQLAAIILEQRQAWAEVFSRETSGGGPSPADFLAKLSLRGEQDQGALFIDYVSSNCDAFTNEKYILQISRAAEVAQERIDLLLEPGQRAKLKNFNIKLSDVRTAVNDPVDKLLEAARLRFGDESGLVLV